MVIRGPSRTDCSDFLWIPAGIVWWPSLMGDSGSCGMSFGGQTTAEDTADQGTSCILLPVVMEVTVPREPSGDF